MIAWAPLRIQGILGSAVTKICSWKNDLPTQRYLTPLPSVPGQYFLYVSVPQIQWVPLIFRNKPLLGIMASLYLNFPLTLTPLMRALFLNIWFICFGREWVLGIQARYDCV